MINFNPNAVQICEMADRLQEHYLRSERFEAKTLSGVSLNCQCIKSAYDDGFRAVAWVVKEGKSYEEPEPLTKFRKNWTRLASELVNALKER